MGGMSADAYVQQLLSLLPRGLAWPRKVNSTLGRVFQGAAETFALFDQRATSAARQFDPRVATDLIDEWERELDLPDPCVTEPQSLAQRQAAAFSKLTAEGGASKPYFIKLAEDMGYPGATIDVYRPFTCDSTCDDALWPEDHRFYWQLNLPDTGGIFYMTCESPCDSHLATWGDTALECRVNQIQPAEMDVAFAYIEE